jgi:hypothetical protein
MTRIYTPKESKNIVRIKAVVAKVQAAKKLAARRRIEEIKSGVCYEN